MNNKYLKSSDIGGGIALAITISALLYFTLSVPSERSNIDSDIATRTQPVGQVQIAEQNVSAKTQVNENDTDTGDQSVLSEKSNIDSDIATRTRPVGQVQIAEQNMSAETQVNDNDTADQKVTTIVSVEKYTSNSGAGELAKASCFTCHQTGLMGAPRVGNRSDWEKRLELGFDTLVSHALEGFNSMPARGGNPGLSDIEIENAILFMLEQSELTVPGKTIVTISPEVPDIEVGATSSDGSVDVKSQTGNGLEEVTTDTESKNQIVETDTTSDRSDDQNTLKMEEKQEQAVVKILPGKEYYDNICASCHQSGENKSPRLGEQKEWITSFSKGIDALTKEVAEGSPSHPKDIQNELTDIQIKNAIEYIMQQTFWPSS